MDIKQALLAKREVSAQVEIPGIGTVTIRPLTRGETLRLKDKSGAELERRAVAWALLDPQMSEAEVGDWQQVAPAGELQLVADKIQELSGLTQERPK